MKLPTAIQATQWPAGLADKAARKQRGNHMDDVDEAERRRLRKLWREHHAEHEKVAAEWRAMGYQYPPPVFPPFPDELRGLTCGAKTRAGTPCKRKDLYTSARCPLHGGLSTGPTTPEGKAKAAENGRKPKREKRTP